MTFNSVPVSARPALAGAGPSLAVAALCVLATGCSARSHPSTPAAPALCQAGPELSRLVVTRVGLIQQSGMNLVPSPSYVTDPAKVRSVQRALCALPVRPPGVYHCPADFGVGYVLAFYRAQRALPTVTVHPTGCQLVTGLGRPVRWTVTTPRFWVTLGRAIGIAHTGIAAFSCQPPVG